VTRVETFAALGLFIGTCLVLSRHRWFARSPVVERLRPYSPGGFGVAPSRGIWSVDSFREVVGPLSRGIGAAVSRLFGVSEELDMKLRRLHSPMDSGEFRTRQVGFSLAVVIVTAGSGAALGLSAPTLALATIAAPMLAFLVIEHRVVAASEARQERLRQELPVVPSSSGCCCRRATRWAPRSSASPNRGQGVSGQDLRRVDGARPPGRHRGGGPARMGRGRRRRRPRPTRRRARPQPGSR
jgi:tight adherence protein C